MIIGRARYRLCLLLFKDVVQEILTDHMHPEFGTMWMPPDGEAFVACKQAHEEGYVMAQLDFYKDGVKGWKGNPAHQKEVTR